MRRCAVWMMLSCVVCGCGGGYVMTAGDQLAPAGGEAATVIRLQQSELPLVTPPARDVAVRFCVADCPQRSARTDKNGYAAAAVPLPAAPGSYEMTVAIQDTQGEEARWAVRTFAWDADRPVVAIELDALPHDGKALLEARAALAAMAQRANILYLTRQEIDDLDECRRCLQADDLPDGPVLSWHRTRWPHKGIVSPLPALREQFPYLEVGIGASKLAMAAFEQAGMKGLAVGEGGQSWAELAKGDF